MYLTDSNSAVSQASLSQRIPVLRRNVVSENPAGLKGRVVDQAEHAPIRNVYILVHRNGGADKAVRTDESGRYSIDLLPNLYDVFISADGLAPTCRKVEIKPDGMMVLDAVLSTSDIGMSAIAGRQ